MILLSFRRDRTSRLFFSREPQWLDTGCCCGEVHEFAPQRLGGKRVLFMIHGYENTSMAAETNFVDIKQGLCEVGIIYGPTPRFDEVVGVLWPGQTQLGFWTAEHAADITAAKLRDVIAGLGLASASIVTHSLGARVALGCLHDGALSCKELVMLAPAVDDNSIDRGGRYCRAVLRSDRIAVCYSRRDEVLGRWFRRFSRFLNFNDVALGYSGPRDPAACMANVRTFDGTPYVPSHGAWMTCKEMYAAWVKGWPIGGAAQSQAEPEPAK